VLRWHTPEEVTEMPTRHISFRVPDTTFEGLDRLAGEAGQPRSRVANDLLEEGLRMADHPGIVFRSGPAGRRPALARGPDVWEISSVFRQVDAHGDAAIALTAEMTGLSENEVRIAVRYYADHSREIDAWINRVQAEADRAEEAWRREQQMLG